MASSEHWNVHTAWSLAGVGTSIVLELKSPPQQSAPSKKKSRSTARVAFDIGATDGFSEAIPAKYVFVSHGHVDHVGGLFAHARAHAVLCGGQAPTYFVPAQLLPQVEKCRDAMSSLDAVCAASVDENDGSLRGKSLIKMNLVSVKDGDEVQLKGIHYGSKTSFYARAVQVDHAGHPTLGYVLGSRTAGGLKPEYRQLDGARIRELVKSGVSIKGEPVERVEFGYTGDTCARGLVKRQAAPTEEGLCSDGLPPIDQMFSAQVLFCELTFLDSNEDELAQQKADERGHLHVNHLESIFGSHNLLASRSERTGVSGSIVFYHLSAKYRPARRALDFIAKGLPKQLALNRRIFVAVASMLSPDEAEDEAFTDLIHKDGCIELERYVKYSLDSP